MRYWEKELLELERVNIRIITNLEQIISLICKKYKITYLFLNITYSKDTIIFSNSLDEFHLKRLVGANNEAIKILNKHPYHIIKQILTNNQLKINGKLHF